MSCKFAQRLKLDVLRQSLCNDKMLNTVRRNRHGGGKTQPLLVVQYGASLFVLIYVYIIVDY